MLITINCKCGKQFRVDDSMVGETISCMGCGKDLVVRKPESVSTFKAARPTQPIVPEPPAPPPLERPAAPVRAPMRPTQPIVPEPPPPPPERPAAPVRCPMHITVNCPCGKTFRVDGSMAGETIHCMGCGREVVVPRPSGIRPVRPTQQILAEPPPPPDHEPEALPEPPAPLASGRDFVYWAFVLALFPLAIILGQPQSDSFRSRLEKSLRDVHPETREKVFRILDDPNEPGDLDDIFKLLPGHRLEGAAYSRFTSIHWLFAVVTIVVFAALLGNCFTHGTVPVGHLVAIGLFTATVGIGILLIVHLSPIGWFIAALHFSAEADRANFWTVLVAFTLGVGLFEEGCKSIALLWYLVGRPTIGWRQACLGGLATGAGFGIAEGIMYSTEFYNGVEDHMAYLVRFASCVTLHALWSASAGITLFHSQDLFRYMQNEGREDRNINPDDLINALSEKIGSMISRYGIVVLRMVAVVMVLHGLYDAALTVDMNLLALLTALVSFAWLAWQIEECRRAEAGALEAAASPAVAEE